MKPDIAGENESNSLPPKPARGSGSAAAWTAFERRLLGEEVKVDAGITTRDNADELSDERLDALLDITALRTGEITAAEIDPRSAARWIQLFGLETLRMMLAITDSDESFG